MSNKQKFIDIAREWVGTTESPEGSNRGFHIDIWNKASGVPVGSFWCASFMSAVANRWKYMNGKDWYLGTSADCDVWLARGKKLKILHTNPQVGDIGLITSRQNKNDAVHILVVSNVKDGVYSSIEGNSNTDGSRNGTKVVERTDMYAGRAKSNVVFLRWSDLYEEDSLSTVAWTVTIGADEIPAISHDGRLYSGLRQSLEAIYGESTKVRLSFDSIPYWDEGKIPCNTILVQGKLMVAVREFADWQNLNVDVDSTNKSVILNR